MIVLPFDCICLCKGNKLARTKSLKLVRPREAALLQCRYLESMVGQNPEQRPVDGILKIRTSASDCLRGIAGAYIKVIRFRGGVAHGCSSWSSAFTCAGGRAGRAVDR